jgi:hypothetical protein
MENTHSPPSILRIACRSINVAFHRNFQLVSSRPEERPGLLKELLGITSFSWLLQEFFDHQ